ncbi:hypothetical protein HK414_23260 [Ramlibacter terrae]|uniref:Uncharacterized protein n=1 Tax=Ramlibacter terrae TaxID=2732511 RepID=A0ABX6P815_9BURK|nr:hypothetical protein HK414_23260 [Ramlibacter terrae]
MKVAGKKATRPSATVPRVHPTASPAIAPLSRADPQDARVASKVPACQATGATKNTISRSQNMAAPLLS